LTPEQHRADLAGHRVFQIAPAGQSQQCLHRYRARRVQPDYAAVQHESGRPRRSYILRNRQTNQGIGAQDAPIPGGIMYRLKLLLAATLLGISSLSNAALNVFACEPEWAALAREIGADRVKITAA